MLRRIGDDEAGSTMIEIIVAGMLLVIVALGVFKGFDAATRSTAEERHRARAHSIAEADLTRMRTMRISALSNLVETRVVTQDGTPYTVNSRADYQTDATGTASCESGLSSADYIKISSTITWPSIGTRPPVAAATLVAPPNGSVSATSGSLAIGVEDADNVGIPGVGLSGSGAGSFSGTTGDNGCAVFGNLPAGNYTLTVSGIASGLVDRDGAPPGPIDTSVVAESTNTVVLQYDDPGAVSVTFTTRVGGTLVASSADSIVTYNTGTTAPRLFGVPGTPSSQIDATSLFPFTSPYSVYAGTCEGDNPNPTDEANPPGAPALASVLVPRGSSTSAAIELPALHMTVWSGSSGSPGSKVSNARVRIADLMCPDDPTTGFQRTFFTNAQGALPDPGLPYSSYSVCADNGVRRRTIGNVDVKDFSVGTTINLYLLGSGSQSGVCP
jgi:Tfp pilus assembly protein PilV